MAGQCCDGYEKTTQSTHRPSVYAVLGVGLYMYEREVMHIHNNLWASYIRISGTGRNHNKSPGTIYSILMKSSPSAVNKWNSSYIPYTVPKYSRSQMLNYLQFLQRSNP